MEGFRREDPPSVPQLAVPVAVPENMLAQGLQSSQPLQRAIGDLGVIGFYFLLRSGEYTRPKKIRRNGKLVHATRTKQFRVQDIGFWRDGKQLSRYSDLSTLLTADAASMRITNQKNGRMGELIYQEGTGPNGAVASLARRVHHILSNNGTDENLICDVFDNGQWHAVTGSDMVAATRQATQRLRLHDNGFDPDLVGSHSLRSGGAMALKLLGYRDSTIRKLGRWSSDTWSMYIHTQIDQIHHGVAAAMSQHLPFKNIAFIEPPRQHTAENLHQP